MLAKLKAILDTIEENGERSFTHEYHTMSINIQNALGELGISVEPVVAALIWEAYSLSMNSSWLSGAETVKGAREVLVTFVDDVYETLVASSNS
ncbi:TPA: hypothetical protein I7E95_002534 [Vibrio cholerae]|nr:hypothetical protein [Vibrio cholerae]